MLKKNVITNLGTHKVKINTHMRWYMVSSNSVSKIEKTSKNQSKDRNADIEMNDGILSKKALKKLQKRLRNK